MYPLTILLVVLAIISPHLTFARLLPSKKSAYLLAALLRWRLQCLLTGDCEPGCSSFWVSRVTCSDM